jgi:hypothetical protein
MFEYEQHNPVDSGALAELFSRVGWDESDPSDKLDWMVANSEDWVTCRVDGELIGFGRTFRLSPGRTVLFDLVVDERFYGFGVDEEIVRRLSRGFLGAAQIEVFRQDPAELTGPGEPLGRLDYWVPLAPPETYLGN